MCNSWKTYSTFFAQSGGLFSVINAQLVRIVHMITTLNNLQAFVKEVTYFTMELRYFYIINTNRNNATLSHGARQ